MTPSILSTAYDRLLAGFGLAAGLAVGALAILITLDVLLRNLGVVSFPWLLEVSEYVLYVSTFLAAPWVLREGAHVRVDILLMALPVRLSRLISAASEMVGAATSGVLAWYGARIAADAWSRGDILVKEIAIPEWWLLAVIPISGALLVVEFLRRLAMRDHEA